MGCGCAGSTPRRQATAPTGRSAAETAHQNPTQVSRPAGGPGQPGYTWNGPERAPQRVPEPATK